MPKPRPKSKYGPLQGAFCFFSGAILAVVCAIAVTAVFAFASRAPATMPDLTAVQRRFPGAVVGARSPPSFLLSGLLSASEVQELLSTLESGWAQHESPGQHHGMVSLDKAPSLNASAPVQRLNARLAALVDLPETHVEEGYFSVYTAGHDWSSLHLDNHHALFSPKRVASFVIYLKGEDSGLVGGATVFPLAKPTAAEPVPALAPQHALAGLTAQVQAADAGLHARFELGADPQRGRICGRQGGAALCAAAAARANDLCTDAHADEALAVRAKAGDAVLFYHDDPVSREPTVRALHSSCSVEAGTKIVLAKFVRAGPKPYGDENAFTEARAAFLRSQRR